MYICRGKQQTNQNNTTMKQIVKIFIAAAVALFAAEATADAQLLKNLLNKAKSTTTETTTTTETVSEATTNGQAAGAALRALYTQYKADGKKLDMSNLSNMLNLATLASSVEGLKGMSNKTAFYKDFAKGLVSGSNNLVTSDNSTSVMNGLTNLVNNVDLSGLTQKAESTASSATSAITSALSGATDKANTAVENASQIASSVSSILNLFKYMKTITGRPHSLPVLFSFISHYLTSDDSMTTTVSAPLRVTVRSFV